MDLQKQFPVGKPVDVYITHVHDDSGNYFVQINNEEAEKLDELMEEIDQYVSNGSSVGLRSTDVEVGAVYLAQYSVDAKWYRARVLAVKPTSICDVHFIDYGNIEQIPVKFVRTPSPTFLRLPAQAFECELDGICKFRGPNFQNAIATLKESILEQELVSVTTSMKNGVLIANLFKDPSCSRSILDDLLSKVQRIPQASPRVMNTSSVTDRTYQTLTLKQESFLDFHVSHVEDPYSFSCQLLQEIPKVLELLDELAEEYSDVDIPLMSSTPGYPCCAKFYEDECWYRAVITDSHAVASGSIDVKFVDYGNSQTTSLSDVKELKEKYLDIPIQAIECTLQGVRPSGNSTEWSPQAKELFSKLTSDKHIIAQVFDKEPNGKYQVQLIDTTGEMDMQLDQILIAAKYAEKDGNSSLKTPLDMPHGDRYEAKPTTVSFPYTREVLTPGKEEKVLISSITSPALFYCMLYRTSTQLEKLMGNITRHYARLGPDDESLLSPSIGDPCCAKFTDDNSWYRAVVTDVLSSGKVKVLFVDYGNSDTVKLKDVKKLAPQFSELPCQGVKCSMHRICPNDEDWKTADIKKFEDLALEFTGKLTVISQNDAGLHSVELVISLKGKSINVAESLLLGGNARLVEGAFTQTENLVSVSRKKFPKLTLTLGTYEDIVVSYTDDPANFWCQLLKYKDDLDAIMNAVEEHCLSSSSALRSPEIGVACCAQYSDEAWYRATITGIKKNNQVEVHFVDYGNHDIVSTSKLRDVKPELMNLPAQAFRCRLEQLEVKNVTSFLPEVIDKFNDITIDKELVGMIASYDESSAQYLISCTDTSGGNTLDIYEQIAPLVPQSNIKQCVVLKQDLKQGRREHVCVTTVTGLAKIYCQLMRSSSQLDSLMVSMDDHYNKLTASQEELIQGKVGDYCVAKYSEDGSWYRARIQEIKSDTQLSVFYIDFGNGEELPTKSVKRLLPTFAQLPEQLITCCLAGETSGFSDSQFVDLTLDQEFDMEIVSCQDGITAQVMLFTRDTNKPITELLTKNSSKSSPTINQSSLQVGSTETVYVTHSSGISKFYVQSSKCEDSLANIMDQIHEYYSSLSGIQDALESPRMGSFCVANFGQDNGWYRAQITAVNNDTVKVFYIDYGNSEVLPVSRVKILKPEFASLPAQALHCKLAGASGVRDEDSMKFQQMVEDPELAFELNVVSLAKDGAYEVNLKNKKTGKSLNLMFSSQISRQIKGDSEPGKLSIIPLKPREIYAGQCPVASSPSKFWFNLNDRLDALYDLLDTMSAYYTSLGPFEDVHEPYKNGVGSYCCCQYSVDLGWYRAKILSVDSIKVGVIFVDFGNSEKVAANDLKKLREEFQVLPEQAIQCRLNEANPISESGWSDEAVEAFRNLVVEKDAVIRVIKRLPDDSFLVDLLDETGSKDFALDALVKSGFAKGPSTIQDYQPFAKTFNKGEFVDVSPIWCQTPHKFYCQVLSERNIITFNQMTSELQSVYSSMSPGDNVLTEPNVGMPCCALYTDDNTWNRGKIMEITNNNSLQIRFVDYGNEVTVELSQVKSLLPEFLNLPIQCVHCCLSSVKPATGNQWSQAALEKFSTLVHEKHLVAQVISTGENGNLCVELFDTQDESIDINIAQVLVAENLAAPTSASKSEQVPNTLPKLSALSKLNLSSGDIVYVTAVDSPAVMYCQLGGTEDRLDHLMTSLKDFYESPQGMQLAVKSVSPNDVCVALFSEDGAWYRAVAEEILGEEIVVRFIDYGNTDNLKLESIKPIDKQFLTEQMLAVECTLSGVRPVSDNGEWGTEVTDFLLNAGGDEGFVVNINSTGNDLEVSLQNSEGDLAQRLINEGLAIGNQQTSNQTSEPVRSVIQPSRIKRYSAPQINIGSTTEIYITDITSPGHFHCQLAEYGDNLDEMMNAICDYYGNLDSSTACISSPVVGLPCVAIFEEDSMWYRAIIESLSGSDVKVKFVDYGNTQTMKATTLKQIEARFMELPVLAVQATLDLQKTWTAEETANFTAVTGEDKLSAEVTRKENDHFVVRIFHEGHCISDRLLKKTDENSSQVEQAVVATSQAAQADIPCQVLQPNQTENVYIVFAESSSKICVQLSSYSDSLDEVMARIDTECRSTQTLLKEDQITEGLVCCALFEDGWYRAVVTNKPSPESVSVEYIDYGNIATLEHSALRTIPESCVALPRQAIHCILDSVGLETVSKEILEETLMNIPLTATFIENNGKQWKIKLKQDSVDVIDMLLINSEVISDDYKSYSKQDIVLQSTAQVFVSHIESPGEFYIQKSSSTDELSLLSSRLNEVYEGLDPINNALKADIGSICCAQFSEDNSWYRGIVTALPDESHTKVHFVDYGNSDVIESSKVMVLKGEFLNPPILAVCCSLETTETKWTDAEMQKFETLVFDKKLMVEFVAEQDKQWQVCLKLNGTSILDLIRIEEPETERQETAQQVIDKKTITAGQVGECFLSHAESIKVFYLQFADDPSLDKVADLISKVYPSVGPTEKCLTNCQVGSYCCVKFSEDEVWYRAVVKELCTDTTVKVTFVDYGNSEVVAVSSLKKLEPELLAIPVCAVPCTLADTKVEWSVTDAQSVEAEMLDKAMAVTFVAPNKTGWDVKIEVEGKCLNSLPYLTAENQEQEKSFTSATLCVGKSEEVKFLSAESVNNMFVQPVKSENELTDMMNNIAESNPTQTIPLSEVSAGMPCLCKFSEDNEWYRAKVLEVKDPQVLVNYVDYGNSETVDCSHLSPIAGPYLSLPAQAINCSVINIPVANADTIITKLNEEYIELPLKAEVIEKKPNGVHQIKLFEANGSELLTSLENNANSIITKEPVPATEHQPTTDRKVVTENGNEKEECGNLEGNLKKELSEAPESVEKGLPEPAESIGDEKTSSSDDVSVSSNGEISLLSENVASVSEAMKDSQVLGQDDFKADSIGVYVSNDVHCSLVQEEKFTPPSSKSDDSQVNASSSDITSNFGFSHKVNPGFGDLTEEEIAYYSNEDVESSVVDKNLGAVLSKEGNESLLEKIQGEEDQIFQNEVKQESSNYIELLQTTEFNSLSELPEKLPDPAVIQQLLADTELNITLSEFKGGFSTLTGEDYIPGSSTYKHRQDEEFAVDNLQSCKVRSRSRITADYLSELKQCVIEDLAVETNVSVSTKEDQQESPDTVTNGIQPEPIKGKSAVAEKDLPVEPKESVTTEEALSTLTSETSESQDTVSYDIQPEFDEGKSAMTDKDLPLETYTSVITEYKTNESKTRDGALSSQTLESPDTETNGIQPELDEEESNVTKKGLQVETRNELTPRDETLPTQILEPPETKTNGIQPELVVDEPPMTEKDLQVEANESKTRDGALPSQTSESPDTEKDVIQPELDEEESNLTKKGLQVETNESATTEEALSTQTSKSEDVVTNAIQPELGEDESTMIDRDLPVETTESAATDKALPIQTSECKETETNSIQPEFFIDGSTVIDRDLPVETTESVTTDEALPIQTLGCKETETNSIQPELVKDESAVTDKDLPVETNESAVTEEALPMPVETNESTTRDEALSTQTSKFPEAVTNAIQPELVEDESAMIDKGLPVETIGLFTTEEALHRQPSEYSDIITNGIQQELDEEESAKIVLLEETSDSTAKEVLNMSDDLVSAETFDKNAQDGQCVNKENVTSVAQEFIPSLLPESTDNETSDDHLQKHIPKEAQEMEVQKSDIKQEAASLSEHDTKETLGDDSAVGENLDATEKDISREKTATGNQNKDDTSYCEGGDITASNCEVGVNDNKEDVTRNVITSKDNRGCVPS